MVESPISVSSPPMIPASATAPPGVGDDRSPGSSFAVDTVQRPHLLARRRAPDDDPATFQAAKSKAWSGLPSAGIT